MNTSAQGSMGLSHYSPYATIILAPANVVVSRLLRTNVLRNLAKMAYDRVRTGQSEILLSLTYATVILAPANAVVSALLPLRAEIVAPAAVIVQSSILLPRHVSTAMPELWRRLTVSSSR